MNSNKKAFTLAEIMIVIAVIGIITAILVPIAFNSTPDDKIMKFKKANTALYTVINTLVSSNQYYKDGDLGKKPDGTLIDGSHDGDYTYFCETLADVLSTKSVNCIQNLNFNFWGFQRVNFSNQQSVADTKVALDLLCNNIGLNMGNEIVTTDGIHYYQVNPRLPFGVSTKDGLHASGDTGNYDGATHRLFNPDKGNINADEMGFDVEYKMYCIDIDGTPNNVTADNCVNECPFGYGIRADGKIITGARADEWLNKTIQGDSVVQGSSQNQGGGNNQAIDCTQFGVNCTSCSQSGCTGCAQNYALVGNQCQEITNDPETCSAVTSNCTSCTQSVCISCSAGYYMAEGTSVCAQCADGTYSSTGAAVCTPSTTIENCASYSKTSDSCAACEDGYEYSEDSCQTCTAGYQCSEGVKAKCSAGYYSSEGAVLCTKCEAGTYTSNTGSTSCTECPSGHYSNEGASNCGTCSDAFGSACASCNQNYCTACSGEHSLINNTCHPWREWYDGYGHVSTYSGGTGVLASTCVSHCNNHKKDGISSFPPPNANAVKETHSVAPGATIWGKSGSTYYGIHHYANGNWGATSHGSSPNPLVLSCICIIRYSRAEDKYYGN